MSRYPSAYGYTPSYKTVGGSSSSYPSALDTGLPSGTGLSRDLDREMGAMKREMDREFGTGVATSVGFILELQTKVREDFTIKEKAPTRAISWLKASTSAFTYNYAKSLPKHGK